MTYALIQGTEIAEYPLTEVDIKRRFPNTSFTIPFVSPDNFVAVAATPRPQTDHTQDAVEADPAFVDGQWVQRWTVVNALPEQIAARTAAKTQEVRVERNRLLGESDWTQLPDSPADHEVWGAYRQELRDVTDQEGFPWEVVWPETP